jgi:hypothetical protein
MDLGISFRTAGCRVDMMASKIAAEIKSLLDREVGKILVSKGKYFSLSY